MQVQMWKRMGMVAALAVLAACGGEGAASSAGGATGEQVAAAEAAVEAGSSIPAEEVRAYRLTGDRLTAFHRMQMAVARAYAADPSLRREDEDGPGSVADRMLANVQNDPTLRAAVAEAGLDPREATLLTLALTNASLGMQLETMGEPLPEEVSPEQVAFVKAHRAELERMTAERDALAEQISVTDGE